MRKERNPCESVRTQQKKRREWRAYESENTAQTNIGGKTENIGVDIDELYISQPDTGEQMEDGQYEQFEPEFAEKAKNFLHKEILLRFHIPFEETEQYINKTVEEQLKDF